MGNTASAALNFKYCIRIRTDASKALVVAEALHLDRLLVEVQPVNRAPLNAADADCCSRRVVLVPSVLTYESFAIAHVSILFPLKEGATSKEGTDGGAPTLVNWSGGGCHHQRSLQNKTKTPSALYRIV